MTTDSGSAPVLVMFLRRRGEPRWNVSVLEPNWADRLVVSAGRERWRESEASSGGRRSRSGRRASIRWRIRNLKTPREALARDELAVVNEQAIRPADEVDGWPQAAIARMLGEAVAGGRDVTSAVVRLIDALQTAPGGVVPLGRLEDVSRKKVRVAGRVETLWEPWHPSIAHVGLIADESAQTRVTVWKASQASWMRDGERVRIHEAARNWYGGRVSLAVTGRTTIHFPDRDRWRV